MTKDSGGKFDDYLISPKIRQILLHWGYELKKEDLLQFFLIKILIFLLYKRSVSINSTKKTIEKNKKNFFSRKSCWILLLNKEAIKQKTKNSTKYDQNRKTSKKKTSKKLLQDIKGL